MNSDLLELLKKELPNSHATRRKKIAAEIANRIVAENFDLVELIPLVYEPEKSLLDFFGFCLI